MARRDPDWITRDPSRRPLAGAAQVEVRHHVPDRREFKYLVPRAEVPALRNMIRGFCDRDPHAGPDGTYKLRSLYLDTWNMRLYKANEREAPVRFKARIRCYPEGDPNGPVFAEIKGRNGDVIRKTRAKLPADGWAAYLQGAHPGPFASAALDDFVCRVHRFDLRPICHVEYRREAWMSTLERYARVSIDYRVAVRRETRWTLEGDAAMRAVDTPLPTHTPGSIAVVELKWADSFPRWMVNLVQELDYLRHSFSKYGYGVLALSDDHHVDYRRSQSVWV